MRFVRFTEQASAQPRWGLLREGSVYPLAQAPYEESGRLDVEKLPITGESLLLDDVTLCAPVEPSKIVCVGRNYAAHAAELGNEVPAEPLIFLKPPSALVGPGEAVVYPVLSERVDHEAELAVVIGKPARFLTVRDAERVIFGYTVANDVTARDLQKRDGQWTRGKGFDTFAPVGPWLDTDFEPAGRIVRCIVNGETRQDGNTDHMIFSIADVLVYVSQFMTLLPGDLILTGTPSGVGPVLPGDVMTVDVAGLGSLTNPIVSANAG